MKPSLALDNNYLVSRETGCQYLPSNWFHVKRKTKFMVSRETNSHHHHLLSPDFIAGVVSTNGTFIHVNTAKIEQFGFQIKLPAANRGLLSLICRSIGLRSDIKTYKTGKAHYALLITRSKKELINKVIPYIEDRLIGHKQIQFINWKNMLNKQKKRLDKD